jgi:tryptophan-rich sensory protein
MEVVSETSEQQQRRLWATDPTSILISPVLPILPTQLVVRMKTLVVPRMAMMHRHLGEQLSTIEFRFLAAFPNFPSPVVLATVQSVVVAVATAAAAAVDLQKPELLKVQYLADRVAVARLWVALFVVEAVSAATAQVAGAEVGAVAMVVWAVLIVVATAQVVRQPVWTVVVPSPAVPDAAMVAVVVVTIALAAATEISE